jgi:hypothetical protein
MRRGFLVHATPVQKSDRLLLSSKLFAIAADDGDEVEGKEGDRCPEGDHHCKARDESL